MRERIAGALPDHRVIHRLSARLMVLRNVVVRASESCAVHVARRKSGVCPDASGLQRGEFCMLRLSVVALVIGSLASGPVFAEASSGQQQLGKKDPNEVVCERQE